MKKDKVQKSAQCYAEVKLTALNIASLHLRDIGLKPIDINLVGCEPVFTVEEPPQGHSIRANASELGAIKASGQLWGAKVAKNGLFLTNVIWRDKLQGEQK